MKVQDLGPIDLQRANTLALPCQARHFYRLEQQTQAADQLRAILERHPRHSPLILAGGSNVVLPEQIDLVIQPAMRGIHYLGEHQRRHRYRVLAATAWHELVVHTINHGHGGLENLALIPGHCGAAPVQNIGAYGVELAEFIHRVEGVELPTCTPFCHTREQAGFGYRKSRYKAEPDRWLITAIELDLPTDWQARIDYPGLGRALEGRPLTPAGVMAAVMAERRRKLPDPEQTPNAGSFFKNPVVDENRMRELLAAHPDLPHWPTPEGHKLSAAWLIDQAGWKGRALGPARVSPQHALVLTNPGGATRADLLTLARAIQTDVQQRFGVQLEPEPRIC